MEVEQWDKIYVEISDQIPSGKHTKNYGTSQFLMGKSAISMAIFNSHVKLPEGKRVAKNVIFWQQFETL